jgi:hypothetical protein
MHSCLFCLQVSQKGFSPLQRVFRFRQVPHLLSGQNHAEYQFENAENIEIHLRRRYPSPLRMRLSIVRHEFQPLKR